jgi:HD-GYP domain-containing protein (c-di-GMP phosphodiesterase class II)
MAIGRQFDLDSEQLDELRRAAELHDIGKLAVPKEILHKRGPLSDSEQSFMRQHTIIGERILNVAPALRVVARLVRASHERWDGKGYPDGLTGTAIPLGARIIAACDAYDTMVSDRSHQTRRSPNEAMAELRRHAGSQFDPEVVELLCGHLETKPTLPIDGGQQQIVGRAEGQPSQPTPPWRCLQRRRGLRAGGAGVQYATDGHRQRLLRQSSGATPEPNPSRGLRPISHRLA